MAEPQALPTADEFFGKGAAAQLPTADEFFAPKAPLTQGGLGSMLDTGPQSSGPELDNFIHQTGVGHVLDAFGQGAAQGWGSEPLGLSDESNEALKKLGVFNDYTKGQTSLIKSANEVLMRPAAAAIDAAWRATQAGFGAFQSGVAQIGAETGQPQLGRDIAAMPEAFMGSPHPMGIPTPADLVKARDLGIIGGDEATWKGTSVSGPVKAQFTDALKAQVEEQAKSEPAVSPTETPQAAEVPDIHAAARQIDPETFQQFDALQQRKDVFRRWIGELDDTRRQQAEAEAPHAGEIEDLQTRLADPDVTNRLRKKYQARLDDLQAEREQFIAERTQGDSADMAKIRQKLMQTDYAMRDLAPKVSEAYRAAQEQAPPAEAPATEAAPPTAEAAPVEGQAQPAAEQVPDIPVAQEAARAEPSKPSVTTPQQVTSITADVSKKLIAAGRPADEANAAAQLIASHYWARAQRFNGAKGSGLDLYNAEGPEIRAGRARGKVGEREFAQELPMDTESRLARAKELGFDTSKVWYHGAARSDRLTEKGKLLPKRATSGPMPFFTDDPAIASSYTTKKADTSLEEPSDYAGWFKFKPKGSRSKVNIDQAWYHLDAETRKTISERAPDIKMDDDGKITYEPGQGFPAGDKKAWDSYYLPREGGGNPLKALKEVWLNSGILFNDEEKFQQVLKLAGMNDVEFDHPYREEPGVLPAYIKANNPLDTNNVDELRSLVPDLEKLASRSRRRATPGADMWAKEAHTVREFVDRLKDDLENGTTYAWTSIPDEVTSLLKSKGYDSILDRGGKLGGPGHNVMIPFEPQQVRSIHAAFDQEQAGSAKLLAQGAKGKLKVSTDAKNTITLFKSADASTFLHETGHQWLEELMGDAADPAAPADLTADAATVRQWLGAKEGEQITRKQHEQFARGFETYMMEGRAPSSKLARVFEQFRQWLTAIYQTVAKLRSPINNDIRDVFDRLITQKPERVTIAPEKVASKDFADLHEADAETTPPEAARPAANVVQRERDKIAAETVPEVQDERLENVASGVGRREAGSAEPNRNPNEAWPLSGEAGGAAEPGTLGAGGSEATPEGVTARPKPTANSGAGQRTEAPDSPNAVLPEPQSDLIDKAGNIRLDNLNLPEEVNKVIRDAAEQNEDFIGARRGVVSDQQVLDLADALGMDAANLNTRKIGQAYNAEQIMAARKLLVQSAVSVRDAMARAAKGGEADILAYAEAKARHQMIQEQVAGITAEAGRALRAFREIQGMKEARAITDFLRDATGRTLFQLQQEAQLGMNLDTPQKVSKFVHDSAKPTFGDMVLEYWINGLISGPATHTTYSVGNALLALWKAGPETAAASVAGGVRAALGAEGPRVMIGEVPAQAYGLLRGVRSGVVAAYEAAKSGRTTMLPGELENMSARSLSMSPLVNPRAAIPGTLGTLVRIPSRGIAVIHSFFRAMNYSREMAGQAYRQAALEGLSGDKLAARIGEIEVNPSPELMQAARQSATDLTLMGKGGELTSALTRLTNARFLGGQWLKFVDPFVHISSNIIEQAILQRTPLGVLSEEVRANLTGKNGGVAQDMAIGRMAVGSALAVGIGSLAAEGLVNGSGPSDPKERAISTMVNGPPHSVRIGDTWYDIHRLGPLGMQLGIASDMYEIAHLASKEDLTKVASQLMFSLTQNIMDESFMRGPADLIKALTDHERYGASYVRNFLSSFVPASVGMGQVARGIDPYSRSARTLLDAVKAKIPWLSETLLPRRDIFGEPIPNKDALGVAGLSAIYETKVNNDPVPKAMLRLGVFPAMPTRKIRGVELTDQQYDDYARISGRMLHMRLNAIVNMPGFNIIPDAQAKEMIAETIKSSREAARSFVMMAPGSNIIQQAIDAKTAKLRGATVH